MNKLFSFLAGALSGALVGAVTGLLLTPASGADLKADVAARITAAKDEFHKAYDETYKAKEAQYQEMKGA